jgi:hypothetical protein
MQCTVAASAPLNRTWNIANGHGLFMAPTAAVLRPDVMISGSLASDSLAACGCQVSDVVLRQLHACWLDVHPHHTTRLASLQEPATWPGFVPNAKSTKDRRAVWQHGFGTRHSKDKCTQRCQLQCCITSPGLLTITAAHAAMKPHPQPTSSTLHQRRHKQCQPLSWSVRKQIFHKQVGSGDKAPCSTDAQHEKMQR